MAAEERSPRYPSVGLSGAIALMKRFYEKERRTAVPPDVAAKAIGYKSASGPARSRLGALKMFGLIEKAGAGFRVSELGLRLLVLPETDPKRAEALRDAALRPALFKKYFETHREASADALRAELVLHGGFTELGARQFGAAFRDTVKLIGGETNSGYDDSESEESVPEIQSATSGAAPIGGGATPKSDGVFSLNVPFSKGTISVQVRVIGDAISPAHLARVRKYLELAESEWDGESK